MFEKLKSFFLDILEVLIFAIGIFFFVYLVIMQPHKIKGASMSPNFPNGEYLLTERVSYYRSDPKRGDVVVFKPPVSEDEYIKRIIALPGESVKIENGHFYINGSLLREDYINPSVITSGGSYLGDGIEITIPPGKYLAVGDNRENSFDSRAFGPIEKKTITGRAWLIYYPFNLAGTVKLPNYGELQ